jgi:stage III sporulation protein AF
MINKIRIWCEGIIIAVVISLIIELLIPEGTNKKYIKVIVGIFIIYVTLNPIIKLFNKEFDIDIENIIDMNLENVATSQEMNNDMKDIYILGIEKNIKEDLENMGYSVNLVKVYVDENYENIEKIELEIISNKNIKKVNIKSSEEDMNNEYSEILEYLNQNYYIEKENVIFK